MAKYDQLLVNDTAAQRSSSQSPLPPRKFETPKLILPKKESRSEPMPLERMGSVILNRLAAWFVGCSQLQLQDSNPQATIWEDLREATAWNARGND